MALILLKTFLAFGQKRNWSFVCVGGRGYPKLTTQFLPLAHIKYYNQRQVPSSVALLDTPAPGIFGSESHSDRNWNYLQWIITKAHCWCSQLKAGVLRQLSHSSDISTPSSAHWLHRTLTLFWQGSGASGHFAHRAGPEGLQWRWLSALRTNWRSDELELILATFFKSCR